MAQRTLRLGDGSQVPLQRYTKAWRTILRMPPDTWLLRCPNGWPGTAEDALWQLRHGMHDRINRHIPGYGRGRKWSDDWQRETMQAAHNLNTPRLIIDWLPTHLKTRFHGRLRQSNEL
ncbi:hypothetical protein GCM10019059_35800 [Camelimonas fluminis]|nr:hypothetical protein GCM10019059_35800 [Camelimonas fluminis]